MFLTTIKMHNRQARFIQPEKSYRYRALQQKRNDLQRVIA